MSGSALVTVIFTSARRRETAIPYSSNRPSKSAQQVVEAGRAALYDCRRPAKTVALANEWVDEVHLDRGVGFQVSKSTWRPDVAETDRAIVEHDEGGLWRDVGCAIRIDRCDEAEALLANYPLHVSRQHRLVIYLCSCLPHDLLTFHARFHWLFSEED